MQESKKKMREDLEGPNEMLSASFVAKNK